MAMHANMAPLLPKFCMPALQNEIDNILVDMISNDGMIHDLPVMEAF
jgi:hypothetical protein